MAKWFTRWNIAAILFSVIIVSVAVCIQSFLTDNKINQIVSGIMFVAFGVIATLLQWLFPLQSTPKISKQEYLFSIPLLCLSVLAFVIIIELPLRGPNTIAPPPVLTSPVVSSPSATATPVVSPTSISAPYSGSLLFDDSLQNNDMNRWDSNAGCRFIENAYHINSTNYYHECAENGGPLSNVAFQVQIVLTRGSVGGIEFRRTDSKGGYYFSVGWDGQYVFQTDNNHNVHVIANSQVAPIKQLTYELGIVANKSSFKAYINNTSVSLPNDSTYTSGFFFLFVNGSPSSRTTATQAIFSDLKVWVL